MTLSVQFDTDSQEPLATTRGWGDFGRWVDGLDTDTYGALVHLREYGWSQDLDSLAEQLDAALADAEPDKDVASVGETLKAALSSRGDAEALLVTNGMQASGSGGKGPAEPDVIDAPDVRQKLNFDCGAAALRTVARLFGVGPDSQAAFIELVGATPQNGTRIDRIVHGAAVLGLEVHAGEMTLDDLAGYVKDGKPIICAVQMEGTGDSEGHYTVVIGVSEKSVWVQDPSFGRKRIGKRLWLARWHDKDGEKEFVHYGIALGPPEGDSDDALADALQSGRAAERVASG